MPKDTYLNRYSLIIKRLQRGAATYEQIVKYLENESEIKGKNYSISKRTLQRDIKDIFSQLDIEIANEKIGDKRYFIKTQSETEQHSQRLLDAYEMMNVIKASQQIGNYIYFEKRKSKGIEHIYGLLHAIKNKRIISFNHYKYYDETITNRIVHPLALKEAKGRWYLLAVDTKDEKLKSFGLDRINDLEISKTSYRQKYNHDFEALFLHSFGINSEDKPPQKVRLLFTYEQASYVKNYPLHHSQKVIEEKDNEVLFELYLSISYDFIMEIMSYGEEVTVLSPKSLINQLKKTYRTLSQKYL